MVVQADLGLDLFGLHASEFEGMVLVDELDGDHGGEGAERAGFADEGIGTAADGTGDDAERKRARQRLGLDLDVV